MLNNVFLQVQICILLVSVANLETSGELGVETGAAAMMCERRRGFFGESVSERRRLPGLLRTQERGESTKSE